jgi:hypothetical protein
MVNGRTFALGAIGGGGVSVQLALDGHAGAWTGSATEEASQQGIVNGNRSPAAWRTAGSAAWHWRHFSASHVGHVEILSSDRAVSRRVLRGAGTITREYVAILGVAPL